MFGTFLTLVGAWILSKADNHGDKCPTNMSAVYCSAQMLLWICYSNG